MKLAVASCSKLQQINPQPVWRDIQTWQPDVLLLLGDTVYLEHDHHSDALKLGAELDALYGAQLAEPNFKSLLADIRGRNGSVLAIYDDHDFLGNNRYGGDHDPLLREAARKALIDAFAPKQTGGDVYSVQQFGNVRIVVLDERFYRQSPRVSEAGRDAILGAAQWQWLESVLTGFHDDDGFLVIASGTTFHSFGDESWEQYPDAFQRLRTLIGKKKGILFVSGDVHRNALYDDSGVVEVVTSAVARNGIVFGSARQNYGLLTFDQQAVDIDLKSLKAGWRLRANIPLTKWELP